MIAEAPDRERITLSVVMPAHEEAEAIRGVVTAWDAELAALGVPYEIRVYDDGSRDATADLLAAAAREREHVRVIRQPNRGHGPTILRGYHEAEGDWVFQTDSDGEIDAEVFPTLWERRADADLVVGWRLDRRAPLTRRLLTRLSRWTVRLCFGPGVRDPNAPYRLFRGAALARILPAVPATVFAPNVILSGLAIRHGLRIVEVPVPHRGRDPGTRRTARVWRNAVRSLRETVSVALRAHPQADAS